MPLSFSVDIKPVRAMLDKIGPAALERRGRAAMQEALTEVQHEIQANTPVYQDALRRGIKVDIHGTGFGNLHGQVIPAPATTTYAQVVEEGRKPGSRPPPSSAIAGWVMTKLGPGVSAFVIARSIGRKGTKGAFMFKKASAKAQKTIPQIFLRHFRSIG